METIAKTIKINFFKTFKIKLKSYNNLRVFIEEKQPKS